MNFKKIENYFLLIITFLIIFSFFLGFLLNENSAGAGGTNGDFVHYIWPNLNLFKENILININSYNYTDSRMPLSYILHVLINPFIDSEIQFRVSVFIISILCPIFFFLNLKYKYKKTNNYLLVFLSVLILLSPYFRTSAFWGLQENYGILCILLSYYFYQKYFLLFKKKNIEIKLLPVFFLTLLSSLSFYFDQKLLIIPLIFFFLIIFDKKIQIQSRILLTIFYMIFALPALYLIFHWKGILPPYAMEARKTGSQFNLYNIGYASSIIFFYIFPFLFFIKNVKKKIFIFIKSKAFIYLFIFLIYFLLLLYFDDFRNVGFVGQGIFHKLIDIISLKKSIQFLITIFIFLLSWIAINFFLENLANKLISKIFFYYMILICFFIYPIFQEYFDPLIFVMIFTFFNLKFKINFKNTIILFTYFFIFLFFTNFYYLYKIEI